jgi:hypothetical protein
LFNLAKDPGETRDLSQVEPKRTADLKARLTAWRKQVGAQENRSNPKFDPALHKRLFEDLDASMLKPAATAAAMRRGLEAWWLEMNAVLPPKKNP